MWALVSIVNKRFVLSRDFTHEKHGRELAHCDVQGCCNNWIESLRRMAIWTRLAYQTNADKFVEVNLATLFIAIASSSRCLLHGAYIISVKCEARKVSQNSFQNLHKYAHCNDRFLESNFYFVSVIYYKFFLMTKTMTKTFDFFSIECHFSKKYTSF